MIERKLRALFANDSVELVDESIAGFSWERRKRIRCLEELRELAYDRVDPETLT